MTAKGRFIAAVRKADISNEAWIEDCLPYLATMPYARGYIDCLLSELGECLDCRTEDYRKAVLELKEYDIWK